MKTAPQTVVETGPFERSAAKIMTDDQRMAVIYMIAADPIIGDIIRGTGGIRKCG